MKIRSLRPEFFADGRMAQLSPMARILYMGLWCIADDEGRGRFHPKSIEGEVFPHEAVDIRTLLTELIEMGRIVTYDVGAESYFHIPKFTTYQHPNRKVESRLPAPPDTALAAREQRVSRAAAPPVEVVVEEEVGVVVPTERAEIVKVEPPNRGPYFETLVDLFGEPAENGEGLYWQIVNLCKPLPPEEINARAAIHVATLNFAFTPGSLKKRWGWLGSKAAQVTDADRKRFRAELENRSFKDRLRSLEPA